MVTFEIVSDIPFTQIDAFSIRCFLSFLGISKLKINDLYSERVFFKNKYIHIPKGHWHQIENVSDEENLVIIEVQYGEKCEESDIERKPEIKKDNV